MSKTKTTKIAAGQCGKFKLRDEQDERIECGAVVHTEADHEIELVFTTTLTARRREFVDTLKRKFPRLGDDEVDDLLEAGSTLALSDFGDAVYNFETDCSLTEVNDNGV